MLFACQEECVSERSVRDLVCLHRDGENRRTSKGGAEGRGGRSGPGEKRQILQQVPKQGSENRLYKYTRLLTAAQLKLSFHLKPAITGQRRRRLIPVTLYIRLPISVIQQAEAGVLPPSSPPVGCCDLSDLLSAANEVNPL